MHTAKSVNLASRAQVLARLAPGLAMLFDYKRADLSHDMVAGLSVAAVALPVGVAYAELAGFEPATGLYSSILPLVAYAVLGSSKQLIVGPDAATCALVAAAVAPLAVGDQSQYLSISMTLAFLAGLICIGASFVKLGVVADFLSKPILVGFLNGIALSIMLGQTGKIFGFPITGRGIVPTVLEVGSKLHLTHAPSLMIGAASIVLILLSARLIPRVPAALVTMAFSALVVKLFGLTAVGVRVLGRVPPGLPGLRFPTVPLELLPKLGEEAIGIALISFSSMMLTSRSFASKNGYDVDSDREFAALGAANIASAVSQGFAISGADSRTALNDAAGGRTQLASLLAAGTLAVVLMYFTQPLQYVPVAAVGAVLITAGLSLIDLGTLRMLYRIDRREFALSILATLCVVAVGAIQAILLAVLLALVRFVRLTFRPKVEILGETGATPGFHAMERHSGAATTAGLLLFRFNAPIVFFNAPYFKREIMAAAESRGDRLRWLVIDAIPVTMVDATGLYVLAEVTKRLHGRGVVFASAGRQTEWRQWAEKRGLKLEVPGRRSFPTLSAAVEAYNREVGWVKPESVEGVA